jgi:hypothetical protein
MFFSRAWHAFNVEYNRLLFNLISLCPEEVLVRLVFEASDFSFGTPRRLEVSL